MIEDLDDREGDAAAVPKAVKAPAYCPRCKRDVDGLDVLCGHCGSTPRAKSFCTVCDEFLPIDAGELCPKHDIELVDASELTPAPLDPSSRWVTVKIFSDDLAVQGPRLRLEAEGIPALVTGGRMGSRSMYHVATGGVRLQVPESLVADARVLLAQSWGPVTPDDEFEDFEDAFEELAPEPGTRRRMTMKWLILLMLFGPIAIYILGAALGVEIRLHPRPAARL